jgi:uncharacterized protein (DUF4415 family)
MVVVRFEGDPGKSSRNLLARRFDFEFAAGIFEGRTLERVDDRRDYGERRVIAIGVVDGLTFTVVYTDRTDEHGPVRRLVPATGMNVRRIRKQTKRKAEAPSRGRADLARLRRMSERTIARTSPPELADIPPSFWDTAVVVDPIPKEPISLRVDADVLAWFRKQGPRYQSRMNAVLRAYMAATAAGPTKK